MSGYMKERDSLMQENEVRTQQLAELNSVLATIATGLDSIAIQENILFTNKGRDGVMLNRQQIAANLKSMADILARQRTKIKILQDSLANKNSSEGMERLQKVIEFLNLQLAEKDQVIKSLRANLNNSKKDIMQLHTTLNDMKTRVSSAENKAQILTTALSQQDEVINECYVKIGTKKQLSAAGLLKGGFLQKKKVNYEGMDKSKFNAVDIRKFREITLKSKNPKILTPKLNDHEINYMFAGESFTDGGKCDGFSMKYIAPHFVTFYCNRFECQTWAVRPVTKYGATGKDNDNNNNGDNNVGGSSDGGNSTSYEKPDIAFNDFTAYQTKLKVVYKIYNKDKAKVTSAKVYYGTSSNPTKSVSATVSGVLITANISGLKKGTTYYVKCVATGKGGTTTTGTTKVITNY